MSEFFINLLNRSITAGFFIIAVILVRFLLKKAPRVFSYALWGIVLLRLLCPCYRTTVCTLSVIFWRRQPKGQNTEYHEL